MKGEARSSDGIPLRFEARGSGAPALVFVHGWSCDRTDWDGQLDWFSAHHQVVAMDLAGHGESAAGRQAWTMVAFGDDVVAVVEALGLDEPQQREEVERFLAPLGEDFGTAAQQLVRRMFPPGTDAELVDPTDAESLGRYRVGAVTMPEAGHFPMMEDPDTFNRRLAGAIEGFKG
jgi:pimeloyl-ACP methyl ester carboxylesterase